MIEQQISVLLIDDDEEDYLILREVVQDIPFRGTRYTVDWTPDIKQAWEAVKNAAYDVYLVDYLLGVHDGLSFIRRAVEEGCMQPMILLTGQDNPIIDEQAMLAGAADYLVKGRFDADQLERAVRYSMQHAKNMYEIKLLNEYLEKRVEERTKQLREAYQQVKQALDKEKELNELKSRFVAMASHEFRTPLSAILSSASLIARYDKTEQQPQRLKHVQRIQKSVQSLNAILNEFLSLSKIEEGRESVQPKPTDLVSLVQDLCEELNPLCKENQHILCKLPGSSLPWVQDERILKNILTNLLSNSLKYSDKEVELIMQPLDNKTLRIEVKDYGIGIPEEEQKYVFTRFFRAGNATNVSGTGLGLHIVKKYVDLIGGDISFQSRENQGTTFYLTIPHL
ncbi:signal transduction histidine kinase [Thermonema lapsum]|uniref:histidine kinase n=1 Tax=Thermonema lapsum TaxID=28195 RepID=A0A846MNF0_9BACT|nr:hybrid sensor histidine kinase/response regulator [Thermonema lapsum]NIK72975.1 signal transduction histidine kinase [Thermonema lapsum]